ncbi:chaperone protein HchA, partial [Staphylococcus aureus]
MSQDVNEFSKQPTPAKAEDTAFFSSPYSLSHYTAPKTDCDGVEQKGAYKDGKWKVLMIAAEERYVLLENGKMFTTGNHPGEMLFPFH